MQQPFHLSKLHIMQFIHGEKKWAVNFLDIFFLFNDTGKHLFACMSLDKNTGFP